MSENIGNLSFVTTEIEVSSLESACSSWNSSISSVNVNPGEFKSAFTSLNAQGVGVACVSSIATSLESIASLVTVVSNAISTNLVRQVDLDNALVPDSEGIDDLKLPDIDSLTSGLGGSNGEEGTNGKEGTNKPFGKGGSSGSSGSGKNDGSSSHSNTNTKVDNGNSTIEINKNLLGEINNLDPNSFNSLMTKLSSIAKENSTTVSNLLDNDKYSEIIKSELMKLGAETTELQNLMNNSDDSVIRVTLKEIFSGNLTVSETSKDIVYSYLENMANNRNMSIAEFLKNDNKVIKNMTDDMCNIIKDDSKNKLINIYDGNNVNKYNADTIQLVRNVFEKKSTEEKVPVESLLNDKNSYNEIEKLVNDVTKSLSYINSCVG